MSAPTPEECIAHLGLSAEEALEDEARFLERGDLIAAAECADHAELCSVLAFNLSRVVVGEVRAHG